MPGPNDTPDTSTTLAGAAPQGAAGTPPPDGTAPTGAPRTATAELPDHVLQIRLSQERERGEKALLKRYNVSTPEELEAKLQRIAALEDGEKKRAAEDEEKKRASMSSEERLKSENATLQARVTELEGLLAGERARVSGMRQGQVIRAAAADLVDPELIDEATAALAMHIRQLKENEEQAKISEFQKPAKVREWFRELVARKPKFAKAAAATTTTPTAPKPGVVKRPITTGSAPAKVVPTAPNTTNVAPAKTFRPGKANSMSDAEARTAAQQKYPGVRIPGLT